MDTNALKETGKEIFRLALFAAISAIIAAGVDKLSNVQDQTILIAVVTAVLRALDKYVHEADNIKLNGISPI